MDIFFHRDFTCKIEDRNEALDSLSLEFLRSKNEAGDEASVSSTTSNVNKLLKKIKRA